jgi:exo-beta-1,3-glucanase (GH17 family)
MMRVKATLPHITVGYVDAYYEFSVHPELLAQSDVIFANCYSYWECTSLDYANSHMKFNCGQATNTGLSLGKKKAVITETGSPSQGESLKAAEFLTMVARKGN